MEGLGLSDFWQGRRVLVTGHTGFKGAWLSILLDELGAEVTGLALDPPTVPSLFADADLADRVHDHRVDVADCAAVAAVVAAARPQVVFHLAAQALVRASYERPVETFRTNVLGTAHVLEAVRGVGGVAAAVVVTSDKCYRVRSTSAPYAETDELGGADPYSASKAAAELLVDGYVQAFFSGPGATRVATARAGNVIGGGDWSVDRLVPDLVRGAVATEPVGIRRPRAVRPWQHVLDPLWGYLMLAEALATGAPEAVGAWNFGPDERDARPVSWVADRTSRLWGPESTWYADKREHPHETDVLRLDSSKARRELGWSPRWGLDTAVERTVAWYRRCEDGAGAADLCAADIEDYMLVTAGAL